MDSAIPTHPEQVMLDALMTEIRREVATETKWHPFRLSISLSIEDGSPWMLIEVDGAEPHNAVLPQKYAMWRHTQCIYRVVHFAVLDDPILTEALVKTEPILKGAQWTT